VTTLAPMHLLESTFWVPKLTTIVNQPTFLMLTPCPTPLQAIRLTPQPPKVEQSHPPSNTRKNSTGQ
jgi:hypothetical protein